MLLYVDSMEESGFLILFMRCVFHQILFQRLERGALFAALGTGWSAVISYSIVSLARASLRRATAVILGKGGPFEVKSSLHT